MPESTTSWPSSSRRRRNISSSSWVSLITKIRAIVLSSVWVFLFSLFCARKSFIHKLSGNQTCFFPASSAILRGRITDKSLLVAGNREFFVRIDALPGKKRGRYTPKYYVFRGFHLSTCYP